MLSVMGVDATPKGVASLLTEYSYSEERNVLNKASSWSKVNLNGVNWGFYNGRRTGFENAFVATLRPLYPLLEVVLRGKTITFMDSIKITGGDGYNTAIIPILEALGCESKNIKTYNQYKNDTSKDAVLKNITTPVFNLLDDLFKKPVKTALEILPNVVYFIDSGNLEVCITNLLLPVTALLEKIEPIYKVEFDTSAITSAMNTSDILKSLEDGVLNTEDQEFMKQAVALNEKLFDDDVMYERFLTLMRGKPSQIIKEKIKEHYHLAINALEQLHMNDDAFNFLKDLTDLLLH
jgi:hypothetical protein